MSQCIKTFISLTVNRIKPVVVRETQSMPRAVLRFLLCLNSRLNRITARTFSIPFQKLHQLSIVESVNEIYIYICI